jgi:hypothetical protein
MAIDKQIAANVLGFAAHAHEKPIKNLRRAIAQLADVETKVILQQVVLLTKTARPISSKHCGICRCLFL